MTPEYSSWLWACCWILVTKCEERKEKRVYLHLPLFLSWMIFTLRFWNKKQFPSCHFYLWLMKHLTHLDRFLWCVTLSIRADIIWLFLIRNNNQSCSGRQHWIFQWGIDWQNITHHQVLVLGRFWKWIKIYKT